MKRTSTIAAWSLAVLLAAHPASGTTFRFGVHAGLNLSRAAYELVDVIDSSDVTDAVNAGFMGGVTVSMAFEDNDILTMESGVFYEMRGGTTELKVEVLDPDRSGRLTETEEHEWILTCLTVPLTAKVRLSGGSMHPYAKVGGEVVIPLSAEWRGPELVGSDEIVVRDISDDMTFADFALLVALGIDVPVGQFSGFIEVSYRHGLTDFWDVEDAAADAQLRHRVVSFGAGMLF